MALRYDLDATRGSGIWDEHKCVSHQGARAACSSVLDGVGAFTDIFAATGTRAVKDILALLCIVVRSVDVVLAPELVQR